MTNNECNKIRDILIGEDPNTPGNKWPIMGVYHIIQNLKDALRYSEGHKGLIQAEETVAELIRALNGLKDGR